LENLEDISIIKKLMNNLIERCNLIQTKYPNKTDERMLLQENEFVREAKIDQKGDI
jgi:hypothetical protein